MLCKNCGMDTSGEVCVNCENLINASEDEKNVALSEQQQEEPQQLRQQHEQQQQKEQQGSAQVPTLSSGAKFFRNYFGLVIMGVFSLVTIFTFLGDGRIHLDLLFRQFWILGIVAAGAVAATQIKGPDLSMGAMMTVVVAIVAWMFRETGSITAGIVTAIIVCLFYGMLNGAIISFLGAPAIIITVITAASMMSTSMFFLDFRNIHFSELVTRDQSHFAIMLLIAVMLAITAMLITKKLIPNKSGQQRRGFPRLTTMLGYAIVAIIAGIAGYATLARVGVASLWVGDGLEIRILVIFAAIQSSRLLKNGVVALIYGLFVALILTMSAINNASALPWVQPATEASLAIWLICAACAAQGGWRTVLGTNLEPVEQRIGQNQ